MRAFSYKALKTAIGTVLLGLILSTSAARAEVRPKILIIFDTSGSMLDIDDYDGSALCQGVGQSSFIYQLKQALFESLLGMGATEVDFALATFPMMVDPTRTPQCASSCLEAAPDYRCSGHYYQVPAQNSEIPGYESYHGCKVSSHNPSTQKDANCGLASNPCSAWYNDFKQEVLKVPFSGNTPEDVMWYFDQQEDTDEQAPLVNPEVRAAGQWFTPLGKSLFYAHGYFHKEVIPTIVSYEKPCTKLVVALFTDGVETCNLQTTDAFYPPKWAANLKNNLQVTVHTVAIGLTDPLLEDISTSGGGSYYMVGGNTSALKQAFLDIVAKSLPPYEVCNGLDDDCDNQVDEDFPLKGQPCDNGKLGQCFKTGQYVCKGDGSGVVCNAPDATGTTEICNGVDDDCDGEIDEIPGCTPCIPQPEKCNGKDDDCDGAIDNGYIPTPCGPSIGICLPGEYQCINGQEVCQGGTPPQDEICNGLDDNCDGIIDGMTEECYTFPTGCTYEEGIGWTCVGICRPGLKLCTNAVWGLCLGMQGPEEPDICDGLDSNCDGVEDEDAECPEGHQCKEGTCSPECGKDEFPCPPGRRCVNGWCILDRCDPVECDAQGGVCVEGECVDLCIGVQCEPGEVCFKGVCEENNCYNPRLACPAGERCVQGQCLPDPCLGVGCDIDEYCYNGVCVSICDSMECPSGYLCKLVFEGETPEARCVPDVCADRNCAEGYVCVDGTCVTDPCLKVSCGNGTVCVLGNCVPDLCENATCPKGFTCKEGMCQAREVKSTTSVLASGSGGLSCTVGGPGDEPRGLVGAWLLLCLLMLLRIVRIGPRYP